MLILNDKHPARQELLTYTEVINQSTALRADIRALRLGILNLMPVMEETEKDILRCISHSIIQIEPVWIHMKTHEKTSGHTPQEHIQKFYQTMEEATQQKNLDGLIITGAPIGLIPYEEVDYWEELKAILDYAQNHIYCTMHLCWAAMAAAYHLFRIPRVSFPHKLAGLFPLKNLTQDANPFTRGLDPIIEVCQSRHTGLAQDKVTNLIKEKKLLPLFSSEETPPALAGEKIGPCIFTTADHSMIFNLVHFEYHEKTIHQEVTRDQKKNPPVHYPVENYYQKPEEKKGIPTLSWKAWRTLFFSNFLHVIYNRMNENVSSHQPFQLN